MINLKPLEINLNLRYSTLDTGVKRPSYLDISLHNPNSGGYILTAPPISGDGVNESYRSKFSYVYKGTERTILTASFGYNVTIHAKQTKIISVNIHDYGFAEFFKIIFPHTVYAYSTEVHAFTTVAEITENNKIIKYAPTNFLPKKDIPDNIILKAFGNFPNYKNATGIYLAWESSVDGISWTTLNHPSLAGTIVPKTVYDYKYKLDTGNELDTGTLSIDDFYSITAYELSTIKSPLDTLENRPDCFPFSRTNDTYGNLLYAYNCIRVRMFNLTRLNVEESENHDTTIDVVATVLGTVTYYPIVDANSEALHIEISQASKGSNFRYNTSNYAYGDPSFKNFIIPSLPGDTVRPISKLIELNTNENATVTSIVAWRDYIMAFTEHSIHLIQFNEGNAFVKTIHTDIGVPAEDARCCKAILNGVLFKSGQSVYLIYPNMYSGTDVVTNITDISEAVSEYLIEYISSESNVPFAVTSDSEYILFLPRKTSTFCLKYDYVNKRWTALEYPVEIYDYEIFEHSDIRVLGRANLEDGTFKYVEYSTNSDFSDVFDVIPENLPYADFLTESVNGIADDIEHWGTVDYAGKLSPIKFLLDSGQKTNSRWDTKQFSESKIVVSTLHTKDTFPMSITIHIDGTLFTHKVDLNTDAAFIRDAVDAGTLSTSVANYTADDFNTYRKMFIRYSGKGMSIRHIIEGESVYPFKLYDVLYRFKELNVKH